MFRSCGTLCIYTFSCMFVVLFVVLLGSDLLRLYVCTYIHVCVRTYVHICTYFALLDTCMYTSLVVPFLPHFNYVVLYTCASLLKPTHTSAFCLFITLPLPPSHPTFSSINQPSLLTLIPPHNLHSSLSTFTPHAYSTLSLTPPTPHPHSPIPLHTHSHSSLPLHTPTHPSHSTLTPTHPFHSTLPLTPTPHHSSTATVWCSIQPSSPGSTGSTRPWPGRGGGGGRGSP